MGPAQGGPARPQYSCMMDLLVILDCDVIWRSFQISHTLLKYLCSTTMETLLEWEITSRYDVTGGVTDRVIDMRDVTENVITNNNNVPSLRIIAARPDPGGAGRSKSFVAELLRDGWEFPNAIL